MEALLNLLVMVVVVLSIVSKAKKNKDKAPPVSAKPLPPPVQADKPAHREESPVRPVIQPAPAKENAPLEGFSTMMPCAPLTAAESFMEGLEAFQEVSAEDIPGLEWTFDADTLVKGVVYAEILGRKTIGRHR